MRFSICTTIFLLSAIASTHALAQNSEDSPSSDSIVVYPARKIVTMEPALPEAGVVAVSGGRILAVGRNMEDLSAWLDGAEYRVDTRFEDKVILPGLIDPHLHPIMAAVLLPTAFITPEPWSLPSGDVEGAQSPEAYRARLVEALANDSGTGPFITWGYHQLWHGTMDRATLDAIEDTRPVIVWHRSFHEIIVNTSAMAYLKLDSRVAFDTVLAKPGIDPEHADFDTGHFSETALQAVLPRLQPIILSPAHLKRGFGMMRQMMLSSGVTTIADMATGIFASFEIEAAMIKAAFESDDVPARVLLVPMANSLIARKGSIEAAIAFLRKTEQSWNGHRVLMNNRIKFLADGAFFSQFMQMNPPGYTDGHEGKWLTEPERLKEIATAFWDAGFVIHCHVNGDRGVDVVLDILEGLQAGLPRPDHRFTLEHFGYSTETQNRRLHALGALVSAQPNYLYVLSGKYAERGLGWDRASQISRLGSLESLGTVVALHSDMTMAPVDPLFLAWLATNRVNMEGDVMAPSERLSLHKALRAITIDAAYVLGMESEIGSIATGKRADFAILEQDPYKVGAEGLKDIPIWGVVFEGKAYAASSE